MLSSSMNTNNLPYAETLFQIKQRYEDASLMIFHEKEKKARPLGYFSRDGNKSFSFSCQGNTANVVQKIGNNITKSDEKSIESQMCIIM